MSYPTLFVLAIFAAVYAGMALGRWPGLRLDRCGIALLGGAVLYGSGLLAGPEALAAIDFATIAVLFGLMILSSQFALSGFYDYCSAGIASVPLGPGAILGLTIAISGGLSAILANDIVVFAMTPLLIAGLQARNLDPRPYLIGLAGGANAGSAATLIGNPQNILIGQVSGLGFWEFAAACTPPAVAGLLCVYVTIRLVWRGELSAPSAEPPQMSLPTLDRFGTGKAIAATAVLMILFFTDLPHAASVLCVAAILLVSRTRTTAEILSAVDWHLLLLFAGLFVVTAALAATGLPRSLLADITGAGLRIDGIPELVAISLTSSNTIGNVPAVMILLEILPGRSPASMHMLAVFSTLAGNLLVVGSIANIIVVERARTCGVVVRFRDHARCGIPMTLASLSLAAAWFAVTG